MLLIGELYLIQQHNAHLYEVVLNRYSYLYFYLVIYPELLIYLIYPTNFKVFMKHQPIIMNQRNCQQFQTINQFVTNLVIAHQEMKIHVLLFLRFQYPIHHMFFHSILPNFLHYMIINPI